MHASPRRCALYPSVALASAVAMLVGCEAPPETAATPPVDPEVEAVERQVAEHLSRFTGADPRTFESTATVPPEIHWSDPNWLAVNRRNAPEPATAAVDPVELEPPAVTVETEPPSEPAEASEVPEPKESVAVVEPDLSRRSLIAMLMEDLRNSDDPAMRKAVAMVGLTLLDPRRELDEKLLEPLTRTQRQQVRQYHQLVLKLGLKLAQGGTLDPDALTSELHELANAPVAIRTFALCRRVDGYGLYETFESNVFPSGREVKLGLYVEIDNFGVAREANYHVVKLSQEVTLFKDDLIVWREPVAEVVDRSRNRRRDFFTTQVIKLPATLGSGRYTLKLRVTDHVSRTLDETTQVIELVADPAMAGRR